MKNSIKDQSKLNNDGFEANNNKPKHIELMVKMRIVSLEKIKEIFKRIIDKVSKLQEEFEKAFNEQYDKEFEIYKQISENDIEELMIDLKDQLNQKIQKIKSLECQIFEFKLSPYFKVIDPLMMIPCAEDIEKKRQNNEKDFERKHMKIKPNLEDVDYNCPFCQVSTNRFQTYNCHLKKHGMTINYQCPICPFQAYDSKSLAQHIFIQHDDNINEIYAQNVSREHKCYTCRFSQIKFQKQRLLKKHIKETIDYHRYQNLK